MKPLRLNVLLITLIFFSILLFGCGQKSNKPTEDKEKPPESLSQLEKNIDSIIDSLDKEGKIVDISQTNNTQPSGQSKDSSEGQSGNSSDKSNQQSEEGNKSEGSNQNSQEGGAQEQSKNQSQQPQQTEQESVWGSVDKIIKDTHKKWNEYVPSANKVAVTGDMLSSFTADLNTLTNDIAVKNLATTLNDANNLYKYIPEFLSHYSSKSVDIKRLK